MKTDRIRIIPHWQALFEDEATSPNDVFRLFPTMFLRLINQSNSVRHYMIKEAVKIIKLSEWRDQLTLIYICLVLHDGGGVNILNRLMNCRFYLSECSRIAGGIQNVCSYHFNPNFPKKHPERFGITFSAEANEDLIHGIFVVEEVLKTLPNKEAEALESFMLDFTMSEVHDPLEPASLDGIRKLMPENLKFLHGTILDPLYTGAKPERLFLRFLCHQLNITNFEGTAEIIAYSVIRLAKGDPQKFLLVKMEKIFGVIMRFDLSTVIKGPDAVWHDEDLLNFLAEMDKTLSEYPELKPNLQYWRSISSITIDKNYRKRYLHWDMLLEDSPHSNLLLRLVVVLFSSANSDEFLDKSAGFLQKWRNNPYFSQLALIVIGLASNQEHRAASAMRIVRGMRLLLERAAKAETEPGTLTARTILRVLESSAPNDPQDTTQLMHLGTAYSSAWQSQQTFLLRQDDLTSHACGLLLPDLPRIPVYSRQQDLAHIVHQERRQAAVDTVAESWEELHRWADVQLVALRAVLLAFHEATWNQSPSRMRKKQVLNVAIPGREESWHFVIWTGRLFHRHVFGRHTKPPTQDHYFLEYQGVSGGNNPQGLWCADLFNAWLCPEAARQFEATWGRSVDWLRPVDPGVLGLSRSLRQVLRPAVKVLQQQGRPLPCVFQPETVYRAALFGTLAYRLSREGAHRGHEALQLRSDEDYLFLHAHQDQETVFMKLLPKGHKGTRSRPAAPAYKVVSPAALRCLEALQHHRWLTGEESVTSSMAQTVGQHAFQVNRRVISLQSLNVCLRFLTYGLGLASQAEPDRVLNLTSHLLRYGFAINARRKGIHLEDLALALNHTNVATSALYSRPTDLQRRNILARVSQQVRGWPTAEAESDLPVSRLEELWPLAPQVTATSFAEWLEQTEQGLEQRETELIQRMRGLSR